MNESIYNIPVPYLCLMLIPTAVVLGIWRSWGLGVGTPVFAVARMILQLVLVGFALTYIFAFKHPVLICLILAAMMLIAAWIALRPVEAGRGELYGKSLLALTAGCVPVLILVIGGVIRLAPWYEPRYLIPIAGMIFANAMNAMSLAAERFQAETGRGVEYAEARTTAFQAALLPLINTFFAVGLVSLPGMMTGQILSGTHPMIAIRYQLVVMCMVFGSGGIASAVYLRLQKC